jgi:hypothetical protein
MSVRVAWTSTADACWRRTERRSEVRGVNLDGWRADGMDLDGWSTVEAHVEEEE